MVSNEKKCSNCPQVMPCATKICKACGAEQPKKARLMKRLQALDMKKGEWLGNLKKKHNEAAMRDEAIILLEKLHAMGYKPLLLLQKEGNGKKPKITSLTPRCVLDPLATQHLSKMTAFYELVCAGWRASAEIDKCKKKKKKKNCSYHTGLVLYPIRSALKERVRKGQRELLIDWEPCAACGKQWTPTWEPKETFV